jgi:hypothetical protein
MWKIYHFGRKFLYKSDDRAEPIRTAPSIPTLELIHSAKGGRKTTAGVRQHLSKLSSKIRSNSETATPSIRIAGETITTCAMDDSDAAMAIYGKYIVEGAPFQVYFKSAVRNRDLSLAINQPSRCKCFSNPCRYWLVKQSESVWKLYREAMKSVEKLIDDGNGLMLINAVLFIVTFRHVAEI